MHLIYKTSINLCVHIHFCQDCSSDFGILGHWCPKWFYWWITGAQEWSGRRGRRGGYRTDKWGKHVTDIPISKGVSSMIFYYCSSLVSINSFTLFYLYDASFPNLCQQYKISSLPPFLLMHTHIAWTGILQIIFPSSIILN